MGFIVGPRYSTNFNESGRSIDVDDSGNVYVTGFSNGFTAYSDFITIKYNSSGNMMWVKSYNGTNTAEDFAIAIKADGSGNVYVTGNSSGNGSDDDYATIKYNRDGIQQWVKRYDGPRSWNDLPNSLELILQRMYMLQVKVLQMGAAMIMQLLNIIHLVFSSG
ncbi:MAG: SBBP repeat-containing protein [Ignavibacteria bacterium]|nr:SBBP repeat-containing protein [Ignavibacteria bacterium]